MDMRRLSETYGAEIRFASEWVRRLPLWQQIPVTLPSEVIVDPTVKSML